jgi:hypothetical protein
MKTIQHLIGELHLITQIIEDRYPALHADLDNNPDQYLSHRPVIAGYSEYQELLQSLKIRLQNHLNEKRNHAGKIKNLELDLDSNELKHVGLFEREHAHVSAYAMGKDDLQPNQEAVVDLFFLFLNGNALLLLDGKNLNLIPMDSLIIPKGSIYSIQAKAESRYVLFH